MACQRAAGRQLPAWDPLTTCRPPGLRLRESEPAGPVLYPSAGAAGPHWFVCRWWTRPGGTVVPACGLSAVPTWPAHSAPGSGGQQAMAKGGMVMTEGATPTAAGSGAAIAVVRAPEELDLATAGGLAARGCAIAGHAGLLLLDLTSLSLLRRSWAQRLRPDRQPGRPRQMPPGAHRAPAAGGESAAHLPARPAARSVRHHRPRRGGPHRRA